VRKYEEKTGVLGVQVEVSSCLYKELGDLDVSIYRISVVAVPSQAVSLVGILQCEIGHVDSLVVAAAAAAIRVAQAVWVLAG
jgi:RNase P/RNase MRP subunit POP5